MKYLIRNLLSTLLFVVLIPIIYSCKKHEVPTIITSEVTNITGSSATCGGEITDEGSGTIVERGVCWSKGITPTLKDNYSLEGGGAGSFSSIISDLDAATNYYVRAYAKNEAGIGYGMAMAFKTFGGAPIASTNEATGLTPNSAVLNGNISASFISTNVIFEYGITTSYGETVTANPNSVAGNSPVNVSAVITGLTAGITYHFRVRAENSLGTVYGDDFTFSYYAADFEGNIYKTVTVGTQIWMAENLKATKFNDGTPIQKVTDNLGWFNLNTAAYCWYNNDETSNKSIYGALYNWYSVDNGRLCPIGWHIPSNNEWNILESYLGSISGTGGELKEAGYDHWTFPNTGATDGTKFKALPGGFRNVYNEGGAFLDINNWGFWWTSTKVDEEYVWYRGLSHNSEDILVNKFSPKTGFSVRCIKDQ